MPQVSVVIPAYNAASFIENTLESVRAQTFRDFEVLVVDDGSSDQTHETVTTYFLRHRLRGQCIRQENKKIAGARNTGIKAANSPFIALLDHDDLWYPQKLAIVMQKFGLHPEIDLICHAENATKDGRILRTFHYGPAVKNMYQRLLFQGNTLSPSATIFKTKKALNIGGFDENPHFNSAEDYDFWLRLSRTAKFLFINDVLSEFVHRDGSASRQIISQFASCENVLKHHFAAYSSGRIAFLDRFRMRRRISALCRSTLWQLLERNELQDRQREYLIRMLSEFPIEPKNLVVGFSWALRALKAS